MDVRNAQSPPMRGGFVRHAAFALAALAILLPAPPVAAGLACESVGLVDRAVGTVLGEQMACTTIDDLVAAAPLPVTTATPTPAPSVAPPPGVYDPPQAPAAHGPAVVRQRVVSPTHPVTSLAPSPVARRATSPLGAAVPQRETRTIVIIKAVGRILTLVLGLFALGFGALLLWRERVHAVREQRRVEDVAKVKGEFLANVSHELKTPLTPVKGYARLLLDKRMPPERAREVAEAIADSSDQLDRVITTIVEYAGIRAHGFQVPSKGIDVAAVVDRAVTRRPPAERARIRVLVPAGAVVEASPGLLASAIEHLLDNALKFSPKDGIVTVQTRRENGRLALSVCDRGPGIAKQDQERIFEEFVQGDGSATRMHGGLGLGLAFVERVAKAHGGRVDLRSTVGKGSEFRIILPARRIVELDEPARSLTSVR